MPIQHLTHTFRPVDLRSALPREHYAAGSQGLKEREEVHGAIALVVVIMATGRAGPCLGRGADVPEQLARHLVHARDISSMQTTGRDRSYGLR
jgi:hypothetical protein